MARGGLIHTTLGLSLANNGNPASMSALLLLKEKLIAEGQPTIQEQAMSAFGSS